MTKKSIKKIDFILFDEAFRAFSLSARHIAPEHPRTLENTPEHLQNTQEHLRKLENTPGRSKTHQNTPEQSRTCQNSPEHSGTHQNTWENFRTPQNTQEHTRTLNNSQKHSRKHQNTPEHPSTPHNTWEQTRTLKNTPEYSRTQMFFEVWLIRKGILIQSSKYLGIFTGHIQAVLSPLQMRARCFTRNLEAEPHQREYCVVRCCITQAQGTYEALVSG